MSSYLIRRLLLIIPTVFFAISFLFLLFFTLPGDPVTLLAGGADRVPDETTLQQVRERYGFDDPLYVQFADYWQRTIRWDLGESFQTSRSVNDVLGEHAVASIRLGIWAVLIEVVVGLSVGLLSAIRRYSVADKMTTIVTAGASAIPVFVLGFLLQYFFAVLPGPNYWNWPEWTQLRTSTIGPDTWTLFFIPTGEQWRYLILPAIALASVSTALAARMTRGSMLEVMRADYMRTARSKGLRERDVVDAPRPPQCHASGHHSHRHRLRNGDRRGGAHRDGVLVARARLGHRGVGGAARPADHPRTHPGGGDRVLRHQPVGRRLLRLVRPTHPSREGRRLVTTLDSSTGPSTELEAVEPGGGIGDVADLAAARPLRKDVWRRFRRNKLAMVGLGILVMLVITAIFAPWIAPYGPEERTAARSGSPRRWSTTSAPTRSASTCSAVWSTAPGSPSRSASSPR